MTEELPILKSILKGNFNYHNAPVRFGRVPKREKARILAAMQQSTQNRGQQRVLAGELDDQPRLIAAVLRAHLETCEFTKEKVATMRQRARDCPSYSMPTLLCLDISEQNILKTIFATKIYVISDPSYYQNIKL
ncbi:unnamed protein product [Ceratitis capitata]|uniref:(Mediterranean fruit fly) hypothetical protein n=1 Tax=Ceratitis capitata TaxID=7213 RepID=A0A811V289_CERCA|nr:unnamed protein product [Ceratitis capitata]